MMKKCAICGHGCKPSAYSCTACGEATWVPAQVPADTPTVRTTPGERADLAFGPPPPAPRGSRRAPRPPA